MIVSYTTVQIHVLTYFYRQQFLFLHKITIITKMECLNTEYLSACINIYYQKYSRALGCSRKLDFAFRKRQRKVYIFQSMPIYSSIILFLFYIYKTMNFDKSTPIDTLLGRLLAFIVMFQKKIQFLKCKLAGNQQFHTRLAFQFLDSSKKNEISSENIYEILKNTNLAQSQNNCSFFVRRYSKNNGITYEEFLKLVSPKSNKILSQRMMIRTYRKGAVLQEYIARNMLQILSLYIKMSFITENIRKNIQSNEDLSHLQLIQFFNLTISNQHSLIAFINRSQYQNQVEYDIQQSDAIYLSYHIKSGNQITQFTDLDIKELICPIDMNFQKYSTTRINTFYSNQPKDYQLSNPAKTSANFLSKTYQKMYQKQVISNKTSNIQKESVDANALNNKKIFNNKFSSRTDNYSIQDQSYGGMYIDNFTKSTVNHGLEINKFANYYPGKPQIEIFQDDFENNSSLSRESAFDRS